VDYISEIKEKKPRPLTLRQIKFCEEYVNSGNATQSAINAGYSPKSARFYASKNLTKHNIKAYISEKRASTRQFYKSKRYSHLDDLVKLATGEIQEEKITEFFNKKQEIVRTVREKITKKFDAISEISRVVDDASTFKEFVNISFLRLEKQKLENELLKLKIVNEKKLIENKITNVELKNKELENKIANTTAEIQEGYLDNITGIEIVEEHPDE